VVSPPSWPERSCSIAVGFGRVTRVVDEADERGVVGVPLVLGLVLDQLLYQLALAEAFPCHLGLDDDALGFEQEI
jgi:hypothetical protein